MFSVFFCLSVKEIAESISRNRLYFWSAHALQLQIPTNLSNEQTSLKDLNWRGGDRLLKFRKILLQFNFDLKFTEIAMSQLVSSGDSIKIWDTSTYDCIYDWPSPGNTTGEWVQCCDCQVCQSVSRMSLHIKLVELWPGLRGELHQGQVRLLPGGAHLLQQELLVLLLAGDQARGDRKPDPAAVP